MAISTGDKFCPTNDRTVHASIFLDLELSIN